MTQAEREKLLAEGSAGMGMVVRTEPSAADSRISQVRLSVRFKDGETVEFGEELANLYQPAADSAEARCLAEIREAEQLRHPGRIPKIQLPLSVGERVPVRYGAADRNKVVVDVPTLQKRALHDYIQREKRPKAQSPARPGSGFGPPWVVPAHCPNCGAPVDQATASRDRDPHCEFCHQPVPVKPASLPAPPRLKNPVRWTCPVFGAYACRVSATAIDRDGFERLLPVMEPAWGECPRSAPLVDGSR